jgi:hypothetical protein
MLARLKIELEDIEQAINFNFTFSSAHIDGREIRKDEEILRRLQEKIKRNKEALSTRT